MRQVREQSTAESGRDGQRLRVMPVKLPASPLTMSAGSHEESVLTPVASEQTGLPGRRRLDPLEEILPPHLHQVGVEGSANAIRAIITHLLVEIGKDSYSH